MAFAKIEIEMLLNLAGQPPLAGRITSFLPFLHFSLSEQAVVAHKYFLELQDQMRKPIDLSTGQNESLIGNIRLRLDGDASVCRTIAKEYDPDLGGRNLKSGVEAMIKGPLIGAYLDTDEDIVETQQMTEYVVKMDEGKTIVRRAS